MKTAIHQKWLLRTIFISFSLFLLAACTGSRPAIPSPAPASGPETITRSLFDPGTRSISEEDIQRLLNGRLDLPDTLRIALLHYGSGRVSRYYQAYWSNEEYLKIKQGYIDTFREELSGNSRVSRIILMPELLLGSRPDIFTLREAAVRLQADLLFIFSIHSDIYYEYKAFRKNEAKAFATCEALLLDIRTGMIPFSEIITRDITTRKSPEDTDDNELRKRAENEAVNFVLPIISQRLNEYLRTAP